MYIVNKNGNYFFNSDVVLYADKLIDLGCYIFDNSNDTATHIGGDISADEVEGMAFTIEQEGDTILVSSTDGCSYPIEEEIHSYISEFIL